MTQFPHNLIDINTKKPQQSLKNNISIYIRDDKNTRKK